MSFRSFISSSAAVILGAVAFFPAAVPPALSAPDSAPWGAAGTPAVVHPAVRSPLSDTLSLDGEWDFIAGGVNYRLGVGEPAWGPRDFDWSGARKILVPGNWESQGVGEPGPNRSWDCEWDRDFWELRHVYFGHALYRKEVSIPETWSGKTVWLKIGGVRSEAYIWIDGRRAAYLNNGCGTEKFDITPLVRAGETIEIVAQVRNDIPSRKGLLSVTHAFGGFYRSVELEATPPVYLDDVWARGEIDGPVAEVHVTVAGAAPEGDSAGRLLSVTIRDSSGNEAGKSERNIDGAGEYLFRIPVENGRLWSPEEPNLYLADAVLSAPDGTPLHGWTERFGIRKLEVRGKQFFLNGKPYFFRGLGDHHYDPMTLTEMPDRDRFCDHLRLYKEAGFNYARHHTHVPLPEYFEAADEVGFLLQPELPYYHDVPCEGFLFDPMRDLQELNRNYRRYTSLATYCCGNEGWLGSPIDEELYRWAKENDPDRLFLHEDGGRNIPGVNADFFTGDDKVPGFTGALIRPWPSGAFDRLNAPFVAHEYLNLAIKMDPRLEDRFTGIRLSPVSFRVYQELLKECGLDETWGDATLRAAAKLQAYYQKEGIESARLDPACDGFDFWSVTDVSIPSGPGNAVAAQGYLNVFWEPRPDGTPPEEFFHFNGPTVLMAVFDRDPPIYVSGEEVNVDFHISHFGAETIPAQGLIWQMQDEAGNTVLSGTAAAPSFSAGDVRKFASAKIQIPSLGKPKKLVFQIGLGETSVTNRYECWVFPARTKRALGRFVVSDSFYDRFAELYDNVRRYADPSMEPGDILIARPDDPAVEDARREGRSLFLIGEASPEPDVSLGWWTLGTQVGTAFAASPAWGDFPLDPWMNQLWFRLIRKEAYDLRQGPPLPDFVPLAVGEGKESYYLYLGESFEGGRRTLASYALDLLQETPEAVSLLDSLLDYLQR